MGFRAADEVVATHDMTNSVTGHAVRSGDRGVILKQIGSRPATFRVKFDSTGQVPGSLVLDDVTDHDIAPVSGPIDDEEGRLSWA